jgi:hypothetical protein
MHTASGSLLRQDRVDMPAVKSFKKFYKSYIILNILNVKIGLVLEKNDIGRTHQANDISTHI